MNKLKNIDTINLTDSKYNKTDEIFKELNIKFDDTLWIKDKEDKGHGCIVLFKTTIKLDNSDFLL